MTRRLTWLTCIALAVVAFVAASVACNRQASAILTLEITSEHGVPVPSGTTEYEFSDEVTATVDESLIVDVNTSIVCTGWVGTGSVPATGSTNTLTFNIYVNSTLEWQWAYEYTLRIYNPQIYRFFKSARGNVPLHRRHPGGRLHPQLRTGLRCGWIHGVPAVPLLPAPRHISRLISTKPTTITWEWESAEVTDVLVWGDPSPSLTIYGENKYVQVLYDPITAVPRVFYYEPVQGDLVVAYYNGTVWNNIVIDAAGDSGKNLCATVTPAGVYHIAYYDSLNGQVKYARSTDGFQWTVELVDGLDNSGFGLDMALDENKDPAIAYFATQAQELRYRSRARARGRTQR
ncbi:MAG: hypothetical protein U5N86_02545 [Planctomycetota bacterium]|nr:hypothetical protein [Planctomycetota bacterium]